VDFVPRLVNWTNLDSLLHAVESETIPEFFQGSYLKFIGVDHVDHVVYDFNRNRFVLDNDNMPQVDVD